jgi:hypothetical protein
MNKGVVLRDTTHETLSSKLLVSSAIYELFS